MEFISSKDVAKYIRNKIKTDFPNNKFRIRTCQSTGSIYISVKNVSYEEGRLIAKEVGSKYNYLSGKGFDGSIDMAYGYYHYVLPNGEIVLGGSEGTEDSRGYARKFHYEMPEGAKVVYLHSDYVFADCDWATCTNR